ncbi:MAG: PLP-dependent aminotransferase family protein [Candidatus Aminicenantales bacterium]
MSLESVFLPIQRDRAVPLHQQIIKEFIRLIDHGVLNPGCNIPSTRIMAANLGVNRSTVYLAYQELIAMGYFDSRPGSYTTVRKRPSTMTSGLPRVEGTLPWAKMANEQSRYLWHALPDYRPEPDTSNNADIINLAQLEIDSRLFPAEDFRRCLNRVLVNLGPPVLTYAEYGGYPPLREYLARRLQVHGIAVSSDEILITNGASHAFELTLKLLAKPGDIVITESPTYGTFLRIMKYYQIQVLGIPLREDGMDLEALERSLAKRRPLFVYTIPNFHNPTGITTPQAHRERLIAICERFQVPIVEDGFEEDMKYHGLVPLPIKSMDRHQVVLYIGTFSKALFPGIRIGWIAGDKECIQRMTAINRFSQISINSLSQVALNDFCREGYYDLHLKKMHRVFRKRMKIALEAMAEFMPADVAWTKAEGGYTFWVTLPKPYPDERTANTILLKHKVMASPGHYYYWKAGSKRHFRLSISNLEESRIREGVRRFGRALSEMLEKAP